jgi:hypothetical protein
MLMHLGALVDDPKHANEAVTHKFPPVNPAGNNTVTLCVPCPVVIGAVAPFKVQLYTDAPPDTPQL